MVSSPSTLNTFVESLVGSGVIPITLPPVFEVLTSSFMNN